MFSTPIAFFIFNRIVQTQKVFSAIRQCRPTKLYIVADGPRIDRQGEAERCVETRQSVLSAIDWPCDVHTNFSERNLGCKWRMSSGLDWVFSKEEKTIILEDDCLPDPTFFPFCEELLVRYAQDQRVMSICGGNYQDGRVRNDASYYFSKYPRIWGWASWRRAWQYYDVNMKLWPEVRDQKWLLDICDRNEKVANFWFKFFELTYQNRIDTWDYQWMFAHYIQAGLTVIPNKNLISNIGCGAQATHTSNELDPLANLPLAKMEFPLMHPKHFIKSVYQDVITERKDFHID